MQNLKSTLKSVIKSYNERTPINFVDLDFLAKKFNNDLVSDLIKDYDNRTPLNYIQVRELEILINKNNK